MKICAAQLEAYPGNIRDNIKKHLDLVYSAAGAGCELIVFPELSLTGYEPTFANDLALKISDSRLLVFQQAADKHSILICAGAPTKTAKDVNISMFIFSPAQSLQVYSKEFLHADEESFFVKGSSNHPLITGTNIAPAICYELSVPEHAANASANNARIYLASVSKTANGTAAAYLHLASIAEKYKMVVLMSNSTGYCDNFESAGGSAVWDDTGMLKENLSDRDEGLLIYDTVKGDVQKIVY